MENKIFDYFDILRGKYVGNYPIINSLKVLSFIAIIVKRNNVDSNITFSSHKEMNKSLLMAADKIDTRVSSLLKDILVCGIINSSEELDRIFRDMQSLTEEELLELNELLYLDIDNKYTKEAGVRTTEKSVSQLVYELTKELSTNNVLDICSGEGGFLSAYIKNKPELLVDGYELNPISTLLCKLRLELLNANYSINEENVFNIEMSSKYDLVFSEYPWGVRPSDQITVEKNGYVDYFNSKSRADWVFINKAINSMSKNGKAVVLSLGSVLFSIPDAQSRQQVVEKKLLESIIALPSGILPWTTVNCYLLIFSHNNDKIKLVDASNCFDQKNKVRMLDIDKVVKYVNSIEDNKNVKYITKADVEKNDYNLNVGNYLGEEAVELINPIKLGGIAEIITGFQYTTKTVEELAKNKGNVTVLKGTNISSGEIDLENTVSINIDEKKISKYLIRKNDILMITKGTAISLAIVSDLNNKKVIPNNILTIIRVRDTKVNPIYLYSFLNSEIGKTMIKKLQNGSIIMNISRKSLLSMEVPVLDIDTQETIANKYLLLNEQLREAKKRVENIKTKISNIYEDEVKD